MTKLFERGIKAIEALPAARQDVAGALLLELAGRASLEYALTPEQVEDVRLAVAEADRGDIAPDAEPEWLSAEQSNSSMILGRSAVLKLLRQIQPGVHPDAEMVRYLTANGFANTPAILGEVRLEQGEDSSLLMLLQRFVWNQGDGWNWTLGMLERLATEADDSFANYDNFAGNLGRRLAEMHTVLAGPSDDPAFAPERMTLADADALSGRVEGQLDKALGLLGRATLEEDDTQAYAAWLQENRQRVMDRVRSVARAAEGRERTRIHGDLHLGQVLVTGSDVMIIDFEGEPARPLAERRAKDLPLRDVAGVLRSFDYAAAVGERNRPAASETEQDRTRERYAALRESAVSAFLRGYRGKEGAESEPLLDLFLLEKAAYEVAYEAANRPDWIDVPVAGLARAARQLLEGGTS